MSINEIKEFYLETKPTVVKKITMMSQSTEHIRLPVDCVAFGTASFTKDEVGKVNSYQHATCSHPDRGKQFGCLLVREDEYSVITREYGTECDFRIKKGRKGAAELNERITWKEEISF